MPLSVGIWLFGAGPSDERTSLLAGGSGALVVGPGPPFLEDLNRKDMVGGAGMRVS